MDIKICEEVGSGGNGSVYIAEFKGEKLAYKLERMDKYDSNKPMTSEYFRQIEFDREVARQCPEHFTILRSHGVIMDCDYKHPKTENFANRKSGSRKDIFLRKNAQPNCYFLLYAPFLEGSVESILNEISSDRAPHLDFIYQIIGAIHAMKKAGYSQNDLSVSNIMYIKKMGYMDIM